MNNAEFWKDKILRIVERGNGFGLRDGVPHACNCVNDCKKCDFETGECVTDRIKWMYAEHVEQPKLTKKERMFCELVETGWIARNPDEKLLFYTTKKLEKLPFGVWCGGDYIKLNLLPVEFNFIKNEDDEPWSVEELLKLEVE